MEAYSAADKVAMLNETGVLVSVRGQNAVGREDSATQRDDVVPAGSELGRASKVHASNTQALRDLRLGGRLASEGHDGFRGRGVAHRHRGHHHRGRRHGRGGGGDGSTHHGCAHRRHAHRHTHRHAHRHTHHGGLVEGLPWLSGIRVAAKERLSAAPRRCRVGGTAHTHGASVHRRRSAAARSGPQSASIRTAGEACTPGDARGSLVGIYAFPATVQRVRPKVSRRFSARGCSACCRSPRPPSLHTCIVCKSCEQRRVFAKVSCPLNLQFVEESRFGGVLLLTFHSHTFTLSRKIKNGIKNGPTSQAGVLRMNPLD